MMEVFQARGKDGADGFSVHDGLSRREYRRATYLFGQPLAGGWRPVHLIRGVYGNDGACRVRSDVCEIGGGLVLRPSGHEALEGLLSGHGEMLPMTGEGEDGPLWLFNCTTLVDALDWEGMRAAGDARGSDAFIDLEDGTGNVIMMMEPMFVTERLEDVPVFKVPLTGLLYLGRSFVDAVEAAGLKGLVFDRLWPTVQYADD